MRDKALKKQRKCFSDFEWLAQPFPREGEEGWEQAGCGKRRAVCEAHSGLLQGAVWGTPLDLDNPTA